MAQTGSSKNELFQQAESTNAPLAERMRPRNLQEFIGQDHILGDGRLLRRAIQADRLSSVIFYGPPGTGKTTLARVIANSTKRAFTSLNAVLGGVNDVRSAVQQAKEAHELYGRSTILFVDEVHRWNKAQQDALLPWVENGTVVLIGATTENPFFAVNSALVSRSRIFQLQSLQDDDLKAIAKQALTDPVRGYGNYSVSISPEALDHLILVADGDARSLLGALELAVETTPDSFPPSKSDETIHIDLQAAEDSIQRKAVLYDKDGDYHYDTISAFIKSLRGSDPDAALYWLARMIYAGEDPRFILRRMLILASEDVGMAAPETLSTINAAWQAFERVGMPEGQYFLAQAVLHLATAPKSNSTMGYFDALRAIETETRTEVPNHLKDPSRDTHGFGHGQGYAYPHAYRDHWVAQEYLPSALQGKIFYQPSDQGKEVDIRQEVQRRREIQLSLHTGDPFPEILSFSPGDRKRQQQADNWMRRITRNGAEHLHQLRDLLFLPALVQRHHRLLVLGRHTPVLAGEALRACREGRVIALPGSQTEADFLQHMNMSLPTEEQALILDWKRASGKIADSGFTRGFNAQAAHASTSAAETAAPASLAEAFIEPPADYIFAIDLLQNRTAIEKQTILQQLHSWESPNAPCTLRIAETHTGGGTRLSHLLPPTFANENLETYNSLLSAEEKIFPPDPGEELLQILRESNWQNASIKLFTITEKRHIQPTDIIRWLKPDSAKRRLANLLTNEQREKLSIFFQQHFSNPSYQTIHWHICFTIITAHIAESKTS